jgi:hypothetical protein
MLRKSILALFFFGIGAVSGAKAQTSRLAIKAEHPKADTVWSGSYFPDLFGGLNLTTEDHDISLGIKWDRLVGIQDIEQSLAVELYRRSHRYRFQFLHPKWHGLCNGWAVATQRHPVPREKTLIAADGSAIHFSSFEIQGLLSYFYATQNDRNLREMWGSRCRRRDENAGKCRAIQAHEFHQALTEDFGRDWIADIRRNHKVSNHPILRYQAEVESERLLANGNRRFTYSNRVHYLDNYYFKEGTKVNGHPLQKTLIRNYRYLIEIDSTGKVVTSHWKTRDRPEFLWRMHKVSFEGRWSRLQELIP